MFEQPGKRIPQVFFGFYIVVKQHDAAAPGIRDHVSCANILCNLFIIVADHIPQDDAVAASNQSAVLARAQLSVWRTEQVVVHQRPALVHFTQVGRNTSPEAFWMPHGVIGNLVTVILDAPEDIGMPADVFADAEKSCLCIPPFQLVDHPIGEAGHRPVVESKVDVLFCASEIPNSARVNSFKKYPRLYEKKTVQYAAFVSGYLRFGNRRQFFRSHNG